jgi:DNA invertase Pin-like site-specific DNA recombinase
MPMMNGRAAQYVRMSTDMQRYSIENQSQAIALHAARRGLQVVRSYEDAGKSGLRINGRTGLKRLIDDIKSGRADFTTILVYDVSRWGRFQDNDESAHYEFLCREAGVSVQYCAEQFENDGSLASNIIKNIKRAMAAETSRELSVRVHAGQSRIASLGFNVGAAAGYGLRRCLIDESGNRKMELTFGQRKSIKTERIILIPGPAHELETVRLVYQLFIEQKMPLVAISRYLNRRSILNVAGREWNSMSVRQLLSNEKYIGNCLYNRGSKKLGGKWKRNAHHHWVRAKAAFERVVSDERFIAAQRQLKDNAGRYTDNEMLDILTAILCCHGHLSRDLVHKTKNAPSTNCYRAHFGTLANAFRQVGFTTRRTRDGESSLVLRNAICEEFAGQVRRRGGLATILPRNQIRINNELTAAVVLGRTVPSATPHIQSVWQFGYRSRAKPDLMIVARLERGCSSVQDYFALPFLFLPAGSWVTISGFNYLRLEGFRATSLSPIVDLCARRPLEAI